MPGSITFEAVTVQAGKFPLLRGIAFTVGRGMAAIINGRSGSGKSILLECAAALRKPDRGAVFWDGTDVASFTRKKLMAERQKIGYMFQQDALIANYSVFDNIALPLRTGRALPEKDVVKRVHLMLEEVALFGVDGMFPESLSAGQQKRAALARALVTDPQLLLLDEPLSGIDQQTSDGIASVLLQTLRVRTRTAVIISHDDPVLSTLDAQRYFLDGGRLLPAEASGETPVHEGVDV